MTTRPEAGQTPPKRGGIGWRNLHWPVIIAIVAMHGVAAMALFPRLFTWSGLALFFVMFWISGGIGITLCYHRLLTHRSFKTPKWFEYVLTACGCLAWQGGPITWVGTHRLHHKHSDHDLDPHSPKHGFTWSHITWTLHRKLDGIIAADAAKDLLRDKGMVLLDRFFWLPQALLAAALLGIGWAIGGPWMGLSWVVWGVALRTIAVFHSTWLVNSATHTWGYQNYKRTGERSTNLWWIALLSFGEGWHNNHHALPRSAAHGLRWFEIDLTWWTIRLLSWVGLAKGAVLPRADQMPKAERAKHLAKQEEKKPRPTAAPPLSNKVAAR